MSLYYRILLILIAGLLMSCGDSDLLDDYIVHSPRALAIKVQDPETRPDDPVSLRLLVGGKDIDQNMDETISWFFVGEEAVPAGTSGYDQELIVQIPAGPFDGQEQWIDLSILSQIQIGSKRLTTEKIVRITQNPIAKNPAISGVQIAYVEDGQLETVQVIDADQLTIPAEVKNLAVTALTDQLDEGENDQLVYRWHVSTSKNSGGRLYINNDKDVARDLLGAGVPASETKESAVFSLRGEEADGSIETGVYDVYLIVRDNATAPEGPADDRFGTDFIYFTLCVNNECSP